MTRRLAITFLFVLAACDPAELVDSALKRTAHTVVFPVVNIDMPAEPARLATNCILDAASQNELELLARDVGVEAGTSTKATIRHDCPAPGGAGLLCGERGASGPDEAYEKPCRRRSVLACLPPAARSAVEPRPSASAFERARLASKPRGEVGDRGCGSAGARRRGSLELEVSSRLPARQAIQLGGLRDLRHGEGPANRRARPLYARPDWKN
jgi:hypothetical protein